MIASLCIFMFTPILCTPNYLMTEVVPVANDARVWCGVHFHRTRVYMHSQVSEQHIHNHQGHYSIYVFNHTARPRHIQIRLLVHACRCTHCALNVQNIQFCIPSLCSSPPVTPARTRYFAILAKLAPSLSILYITLRLRCRLRQASRLAEQLTSRVETHIHIHGHKPKCSNNTAVTPWNCCPSII
jgi:hypothetical protein